MQQLQDELELEYPDLGISIVGVNQVGYGGCTPEQEDWECSGNAAMCLERDLPWLQDQAEILVWNTWGVTYRDVMVVDPDNRLVAIYNVTDHNLSIPGEYAGLRALLLSAAGVTE
jgi:hypothetical protein